MKSADRLRVFCLLGEAEHGGTQGDLPADALRTPRVVSVLCFSVLFTRPRLPVLSVLRWPSDQLHVTAPQSGE